MAAQSGGIVPAAHQPPLPAQMDAVRRIGHSGALFPAGQDEVVIAGMLDVAGVVQIQPVLPAEG